MRRRYKIQYEPGVTGTWYWFVYHRRWWHGWVFEALYSDKEAAIRHVKRKLNPEVIYFD
jgi:hypothetical protein